MEGLDLNGTIAEFSLQNMTTVPSKEALQFLFQARGTIQATAEKINFSVGSPKIRNLKIHCDIFAENKKEEGEN